MYIQAWLNNAKIIKKSRNMRYSDDFMVVLSEQNDYKIFEEIIEIIKNIPNLKLENKKTQFFKVKIPNVINISKSFAEDADDCQKKINFWGFSYDGDKIYLRANTVGKYYYRMNRKAKTIAGNDDFIGADNLYKRYSERGATGKLGNLFTYIENAEKEFGSNGLIGQDLKNHMGKIRKSLKRYSMKR